MKVITVPKSIEAQKLLDLDQCPSELLDETYLSQEQFDLLWKVNFFSEINHICGVNIDDFEDEEITNKASIKNAIAFIQSQKWLEEISEIVLKIEKLFQNAKKYNTSVHFYF